MVKISCQDCYIPVPSSAANKLVKRIFFKNIISKNQTFLNSVVNIP